MSNGELDEKALIGLRGVVKISRLVMNGDEYLNFDGFGPSSKWEKLLASQSREQQESL